MQVLASNAAESPHEHFYWQLGSGDNAQWAVHQGDWKLLGNVKDTTDLRAPQPVDKLFLANLKQDLGEQTTVAAEHPEIVQALQRLKEQYVQSLTGNEE